jgi:hypothetical protein
MPSAWSSQLNTPDRALSCGGGPSLWRVMSAALYPGLGASVVELLGKLG